MYINKSFLIPELTGFFFVDILRWRSLSCVTAVWADCKAAIRDWGLFIVVFLLTDDGRESSQRNNRMACLYGQSSCSLSHTWFTWSDSASSVWSCSREGGKARLLLCSGRIVLEDRCRGICGSRRAESQYELEMGKNSCVLFWNELKPAEGVLIHVPAPPPTLPSRFVFRSLTDGNGRRWWRGRRWPLAPLSWSLTADRMNLCLTAGGCQQSEPAVTRLSLQTLKVR